MDAQPALRIESLGTGYGQTVIIDDLSLSVSRGSVLCMLGRNGVGKTTTLKALIGHLRHRGTVTLHGKNLSNLKAYERVTHGMALVPQGRQILPTLSVENNLRVAVPKASRSHWRENIEELYDEFPMLTEVKNKPAGQLSGGQQQILALARALVTQPKVMLLDEPSEGIQPSVVTQIGDKITDLCKTRNISVLLVEQNLGFAASISDTIAIMDKGKIIMEIPPKTLIDDRGIQHEYLGV